MADHTLYAQPVQFWLAAHMIHMATMACCPAFPGPWMYLTDFWWDVGHICKLFHEVGQTVLWFAVLLFSLNCYAYSVFDLLCMHAVFCNVLFLFCLKLIGWYWWATGSKLLDIQFVSDALARRLAQAQERSMQVNTHCL